MAKPDQRSDAEFEKFKAFGLNYTNIVLDEVILKIEDFIKKNVPHSIFTTGAELIVKAHCDGNLRKVYNSADILTIDSYVSFYALKLLRKPVREPVSAVNILIRFLELTSEKGYRVYLLGAKENVLNDAVKNIKSRYHGINIAGAHHGYFDFDNDEAIVKEIISVKPDIIFVGMSSPLKESFISKNLLKMNVPVAVGVGGGIDIVSGHYKLAPKWVSKIGLEWLFRLVQEPGRLWRRYLITNLQFIWIVIKELF